MSDTFTPDKWDYVFWIVLAGYGLWELRNILGAIREQTAAIRNQPVPDVPRLADKLDSLEYELKMIREDISSIRYAIENRDNSAAT